MLNVTKYQVWQLSIRLSIDPISMISIFTNINSYWNFAIFEYLFFCFKFYVTKKSVLYKSYYLDMINSQPKSSNIQDTTDFQSHQKINKKWLMINNILSFNCSIIVFVNLAFVFIINVYQFPLIFYTSQSCNKN